MLLQTNSYIVPKDKRMEHQRLLRRFRQALARVGCDHFEVYEQVGANWTGEATGRFVQIMRFRDRQHQLEVQAAEREDQGAQNLIREFCELINFPYQQQQGFFAVGFYTSVMPVAPARPDGAAETATGPEAVTAAGAAAGAAAAGWEEGSADAGIDTAPGEPDPVAEGQPDAVSAATEEIDVEVLKAVDSPEPYHPGASTRARPQTAEAETPAEAQFRAEAIGEAEPGDPGGVPESSPETLSDDAINEALGTEPGDIGDADLSVLEDAAAAEASEEAPELAEAEATDAETLGYESAPEAGADEPQDAELEGAGLEPIAEAPDEPSTDSHAGPIFSSATVEVSDDDGTLDDDAAFDLLDNGGGLEETAADDETLAGADEQDEAADQHEQGRGGRALR
jgi:hypothetical protein